MREGKEFTFIYRILHWNDNNIDSLVRDLQDMFICEGRRFHFDTGNCLDGTKFFKDIEVPVMLKFTSKHRCNIS